MNTDRLKSIRQRIKSRGQATLSWDEIEAYRRGEEMDIDLSKLKKLEPRRIEIEMDWRDAEIERLRAGIGAIWAIASNSYQRDNEYGLIVEMLQIRNKCNELLKGGGDNGC